MADKLKWKRTREGIVFVEKRSLKQRMRGLGFMQISVAALAISLLLLVITLATAIVLAGSAPVWIGFLPLLALILSAFAAAITWYAHFHVGAVSKLPWTVGFFSNGAIALLLLIAYIAGLFL